MNCLLIGRGDIDGNIKRIFSKVCMSNVFFTIVQEIVYIVNSFLLLLFYDRCLMLIPTKNPKKKKNECFKKTKMYLLGKRNIYFFGYLKMKHKKSQYAVNLTLLLPCKKEKLIEIHTEYNYILYIIYIHT